MKYRKKPVVVEAFVTEEPTDIETLEGVMHASAGDYIITGVKGERYPCKPDIFAMTYEPADAGPVSPDRDALLDLADRMDGYARFCKERSIQVGNNLVECYARRIREAVDACEARPDAPAAVDEVQTATDAHADGNEAADGARTPSIEVLRWVNGCGGLDAVRESVEQSECRKKLLDCFAMRLGFESLEASGDIFKELEKRLMPEGMEWPTVDGKPVDFVTGYEPSLGVLEAVSIYSNGACEVMGHDGIIKDVREIHVATPKVLDADGAEIRVGDKLYDIKTGFGRTVRAINANKTIEFDGYVDRGWLAKFFTHRAPVIAADGRPLKVGEKVWDVLGRRQFRVLSIDDTDERGEYIIQTNGVDGLGLSGWSRPIDLTHERPETRQIIVDEIGEEIAARIDKIVSAGRWN